VYYSPNKNIKSLNLLDIINDCDQEIIPIPNKMDLDDAKANPPYPINPSNLSLLPATDSIRSVRPNGLVAVGENSSNPTLHPSDDHFKTAKRTLRYLKSTESICFA
jgi:hypothetical protein